MSWIELVAQRRPPSAPPGMTPPENAANWYRIENNVDDADATDIYVYDSIGGWFGMYADEFIRDLKAVATKNINLRINSPGGSVFDGVAIANAIRSHPADVTVFVDGLAASIASVIALAGNKLVMMPQTSFMIHDASGGCHGNAAEMEYMRNLLDKQSDNIAAAYAAAAGGTVEDWRAKMKDETWYTAEEAVAAGLADEVMAVPKKGESADDSAAAQTDIHTRMTAAWDLAAYKYPGRVAAPSPTPFASGGLGVTAGLAEGLKPGEVIVSQGAVSNMTRDDLMAMIREAIRAELPPEAPAEPAAALPPFLKPDEDDPDEDEDPEDATEPEEEPEAAAEEEPEAVSDVDIEPVPDEPTNGTDDWLDLVGFLSDSTPSSADDVFNSLKEAW